MLCWVLHPQLLRWILGRLLRRLFFETFVVPPPAIAPTFPARLLFRRAGSTALRLRLGSSASTAVPPRLQLHGFGFTALTPRLRVSGYASPFSNV